MQRFKVRFMPEAELDLLRLYDFLLEKDVVAAERALESVTRAIESNRIVNIIGVRHQRKTT